MLLSAMLTVFFFARLWRRAGVMTDVEFAEIRYAGKPAAFLRGVARMGMDVRVAAPMDFTLPAWLLDEARASMPKGGSIRTFEDQAEAMKGSRAVYAKAWASP